MTDYSTAACVGHPPEWWHPETKGGSGHYQRARPICERCPVRERCLADALAVERRLVPGSRHGMFGALDPDQRARLARGAA